MDVPLYVCTTAAAVVFVLRDVGRRRAGRFAWGAATALAWPIVLPFWLATRQLRPGERRAGGRSWSLLRSFALVWTFLWSVQIAGTLGVGVVVARPYRSAADRASGAGLVGLLALAQGLAWLIPTVGALLLGLALRDRAAVEHGPIPTQ
jgi:hypothetical protein